MVHTESHQTCGLSRVYNLWVRELYVAPLYTSWGDATYKLTMYEYCLAAPSAPLQPHLP